MYNYHETILAGGKMKKIISLLLMTAFTLPVFSQNYTSYTEQHIMNGVYRPSNESLLVTLGGLVPVGSMLTTGYIWIGDSTGLANEFAVSGDITLSELGVVAIGSGKVTNAMLAGGITSDKLSGAMTFESSVTITGSELGLTYGIKSATGSFSGDVAIAGQTTIGAANHISTFPAAGSPTLDGTVTASEFVGGGAGLTSITAANISAGALTDITNLSASGDVKFGAANHISTMTGTTGEWIFHGEPTLIGTNVTAIPSANISAGSLVSGVKPYSSSDCESLTPASEGLWCYDTAVHVLNVSTSAEAGGFSPL